MTNNTQPEALRLADLLELRGYASLTMSVRIVDKEIAAELRRLHVENKELRQALAQSEQECTCSAKDMPFGGCCKAQPEQKPVAWMWKDGSLTSDPDEADGTWTKLYTAPPKRKPLSSEEIEQCCYEADSVADDNYQTWKWTEAFARAIEAKLKEKNGG